ncbi:MULTISPECIES: universal stress protein [unclassified Roseovarius]|uniref:universal stress protein n=1 Tax=unclassified Roseovarius TaxID=2614913 RepID=UPI00273DFA08|nr:MULTISPECIES: universal stress protein [unclassified Roseovarius]
MYNNILVPISFDQDRDAQGAIDIARTLAAEGATITLIHVIEQIPGYAASHLPPNFVQEKHAVLHADLEAMASNIPNATAAVVSGHAGRTLLDWAEEHDVDCIVIASHRPGMQDLLLGSTAAKVVRHAGCAVHVLR